MAWQCGSFWIRGRLSLICIYCVLRCDDTLDDCNDARTAFGLHGIVMILMMGMGGICFGICGRYDTSLLTALFVLLYLISLVRMILDAFTEMADCTSR